MRHRARTTSSGKWRHRSHRGRRGHECHRHRPLQCRKTMGPIAMRKLRCRRQKQEQKTCLLEQKTPTASTSAPQDARLAILRKGHLRKGKRRARVQGQHLRKGHLRKDMSLDYAEKMQNRGRSIETSCAPRCC